MNWQFLAHGQEVAILCRSGSGSSGKEPRFEMVRRVCRVYFTRFNSKKSPSPSISDFALGRVTKPTTTRSPSSLPGGSTLLMVALVCLIALALRLHLLGTLSITIDESDSIFFARASWREFLSAIRHGEPSMTMTLFFLLLRGWIHLGDSEFVLRCLPVLFGVATIPAVYQLGSRFLSKTAGLTGAALLAAHSCHIRFSQQLRSYSMLSFFLVLSTYFFLAAIESPRRKEIWVGYVIASALAVYAHPYAVLVLIPQCLSLTPSIVRRIGLARVCWIAVALGVLLLPAVAQSRLCPRCSQGLLWIPRPTINTFLLALQNLAGSYTWTSQPTALGYAFFISYALLWTLAAVGILYFANPESNSVNERMASRLLLLWLIFPFIALLGLPLVVPFARFKYLFEPHYINLCVPAAVLLAGQGISVLSRVTFRQRWIVPAYIFFMLALSSAGVARSYQGLSYYSRGHDRRIVTHYILTRRQPGDAALFPYRSYRPYLYYVHRELSSEAAAQAPPVAFPASVADDIANPYFDAAKINQATQRYNRIWLVFSLESSDEIKQAALIRSALDARFHFVGQQDFPAEGAPTFRIELLDGSPQSQEK